MLSLREETQDADKEALPVQPNRRRKASAEERLDTVPELENTMGRVWGQTPPTPALCSLWVVLFIVRVQQREPACLCRRRKQQVGSGKAFFRSVQQTCFADRSSQSWKGLMSGKGIFLFPQETSCQDLLAHPRRFVKHLRSSTAAQNRVLHGEVAEWGPVGGSCAGALPPPLTSLRKTKSVLSAVILSYSGK